MWCPERAGTRGWSERMRLRRYQRSPTTTTPRLTTTRHTDGPGSARRPLARVGSECLLLPRSWLRVVWAISAARLQARARRCPAAGAPARGAALFVGPRVWAAPSPSTGTGANDTPTAVPTCVDRLVCGRNRRVAGRPVRLRCVRPADTERRVARGQRHPPWRPSDTSPGGQRHPGCRRRVDGRYARCRASARARSAPTAADSGATAACRVPARPRRSAAGAARRARPAGGGAADRRGADAVSRDQARHAPAVPGSTAVEIVSSPAARSSISSARRRLTRQ